MFIWLKYYNNYNTRGFVTTRASRSKLFIKKSGVTVINVLDGDSDDVAKISPSAIFALLAN